MQPTEVDEGANIPGTHGAQVVEELAPNSIENLPAMQLRHHEAPWSLLYAPASHARHVDAAEAPIVVEYRPAIHGAQDVAAGAENLPAVQVVHVDCDVEATAAE